MSLGVMTDSESINSVIVQNGIPFVTWNVPAHHALSTVEAAFIFVPVSH